VKKQLNVSRSPFIQLSKSRITEDYKKLKPRVLNDLTSKYEPESSQDNRHHTQQAQTINFNLEMFDCTSGQPQLISGSINNGVCMINSPESR